MKRVLAVAIFVAASLASSARAQETCGEAPPDRVVRARLAWVSGTLRREEPGVRRWWTTFLLVHAAMGSTSGILAGSAQDENFRNEMLVATTGSVLALTTLVIFSPPIMGAGDRLRALPDDTPEARLTKLRAAEGILRQSAANVDFLWGWFPATASAFYVAAAASVLLLALNRPQAAIVQAGGASVIGLGRLLLHPTSSRDAWRRYRRVYPDAGCVLDAAPVQAPGPSAEIVPYGLGLGLRVDF